MQSLSPVEREAERLALLASVELSADSEGRFNELVELAAFISHTPMAGLTIVDEDTAWFKSSLGFTTEPVDRIGVPCNTTIQQTQPLIVTDVADDERFATCKPVQDLGIRFYAGFPLLVHDDLAVGTLCVLDRRPRKLLSDELHALRVIADQAATQLRVSRLEAMLRNR